MLAGKLLTKEIPTEQPRACPVREAEGSPRHGEEKAKKKKKMRRQKRMNNRKSRKASSVSRKKKNVKEEEGRTWR